MAAPAYESYGQKDHEGAFTASIAVTAPSGIAVDDLLVCFAYASNAITLPTGFTSLGSGTAGGDPYAYGYKIAVSADTTAPTYTITQSASGRITGTIIRVSGVNTSDPINNHAVSDNAFTSSPTAPSYSTDEDDCLNLRYVAFENYIYTITPPTTAIHGDNGDGKISSGASYDVTATAGAIGTKTFTLSAAAFTCGISVSINAAAAGGGVSVALTGNSSTSAVGTLGVSTEASVSVTPTGVASSSAIGTLGVAAEINASAELVGVATTSAVGTLTAEVGGGTTVSLSGVVGTSAVGTLTAAGQVNEFVDLLGNSATGAVGTLIIVTGLQVALSGNAATGAVGTLGVTAEINASATLTGVGSSGAVGVLEVTVPITASVELTGVGATGAIGTLTAVGAGQVWTEIPSVSTTWTEIS